MIHFPSRPGLGHDHPYACCLVVGKASMPSRGRYDESVPVAAPHRIAAMSCRGFTVDCDDNATAAAFLSAVTAVSALLLDR
jgi:hypothetical protein